VFSPFHKTQFDFRRFDHLLAVSFVGETRFLTITGEELEETEIASFSSNEQTLFCGNVVNDQIIQVGGICLLLGLLRCPSSKLLNEH